LANLRLMTELQTSATFSGQQRSSAYDVIDFKVWTFDLKLQKLILSI
jgi:hypothetical protein